MEGAGLSLVGLIVRVGRTMEHVVASGDIADWKRGIAVRSLVGKLLYSKELKPGC